MVIDHYFEKKQLVNTVNSEDSESNDNETLGQSFTIISASILVTEFLL